MLAADPDDVVKVERPADGELTELFADRSQRLVRALGERSADDGCWSWDAEGHNVGWVRRRQAHEALIHRVDAEMTIGRASVIDTELAVDGVDEILPGQIEGPVPDWAAVTLDGLQAVVRCTDSDRAWTSAVFRGTSPVSGKSHDFDTVMVIEATDDPLAEVVGPAVAMDLWLWGRGSLNDLSVSGDRALIERLRTIAAEATN